MLSRKYYRLLAKSIKESTIKNNGKMIPTINKTTLVSELCLEFMKDNNLFNSSKFIDACCDDE